MNQEKIYKLVLPSIDETNKEIISNQSIILVGANGSGKTRLGTWIEIHSSQRHLVHRLSAQKSLTMPDSITPMSIERAKRDLLFGSAETISDNDWQYKINWKWQNKPAISFLNDYQKLMVYLFSDETEENAKYKATQKKTTTRIEPPKTKLDLVKEVWENILPHRELIIGGLRIQTKARGTEDKVYSSSEMSDGERVIFYLIGQCLAAAQGGIIVVDEPELHLHKSVQIPLWSEIERLRPDCLFVYLTHDIDFAAAKEGSKRIWLKSFDGTQWDWEELEEDSNLPDDLLLEVLGSRKPVVFVEGENGSYDVSIYRALLPSFLVIPRGSCTQVIQSVKALKANSQLHNLTVYGIIDRDRRVDSEIKVLEEESIFVLEVAEVENLFCTKEIIELISRKLLRNPNDDFKTVSTSIFSRLNSELETQISLRVASEIKFRLNCFDEKVKGSEALDNALQTLAGSIDIATLYAETQSKFQSVILTSDYESLLALYNRKSLVTEVGSALGMKKNKFPELVVRMAKSDERGKVIQALKKYFGNFSKFMD
jgi:hypothetical protein